MTEFVNAAVSGELIKFSEGEGKTGTFRGYGAAYGNRDQSGDIILPGAFAGAIGKTVPMMYQHFEGVIGKITPIEEDAKGLVVEGEFTPGNSLAQDVLALVKHGAVGGLSIRAPMGKDWTYDDATATRTFKKFPSLTEVSVVVFPANLKARIVASTVKALEEIQDCATLKEVEAILRDVGGFGPEIAKLLVSKFKPAFTRDAYRELDEKLKQHTLQRALLEGIKKLR
jgi:uncharacterized protein